MLDKIVLERNRDGAKFTFPCDCWLREANPSIKILVFTGKISVKCLVAKEDDEFGFDLDQRTVDKNKNKDSSSKTSRAFVVILLVLIILIVSIFCCFNQYRRRQRRRSLSLQDTITQIHNEQPTLLEGESSSSGPQLWVKTKRRWRDFRSGLPSYNHARTVQTTTTAPTTSPVIPSEHPPSYEGSILIELTLLHITSLLLDLFPNPTTPMNPFSSSHV